MANKKKLASFKIPRYIINLGKFIQIFSADLTVKYVRFLFQRPINHKTPKAEIPLLETAEISRMDIPEYKKNIAVYKWGTGDKRVFILHGWSGRATQMFRIIEAFLAKNYTVYAIDAPAHGKSTGKKTMMPEFIKSVEKMAEKYGKFDMAVGHSMGGIALLNAQGNKAVTKKLAVIGTPDSIFNIFNGFVDKLELKPKIAKKLIVSFEKITGKSIFEFHGSFQAKKIHEPVLVIHDTQDKEVALEDAQNNYKNLPNGKFMETEGLGHTRILKNKEVVEAIIDFAESVE